MKKFAQALALLGLLLPLPALAAGGGSSASGPYLAIEPAIVINLQGQGKPKFMQVKLQAMSKDPLVLEAIKTHSGPIRHELIMLLSSQTAEAMYDVQMREQIRLQALERLRKVLEALAGIKSEEGKGGLEGLYFTDFVIQ